MSTANETRTRYRAQLFKISDEALALIADDQSPRDLFDLLYARDLLPDARRVLAHTLPKRRALWWGCLCVHDAFGDKLPEDMISILRAVSMYVTHVSEEWRLECGRLGKKARANSLHATLAMAAFYGGGSVAPAGWPVIEVPPFLTGRLVSAAVYLAATIKNPLYKPVLRGYLEIGLSIARGENLWPTLEHQIVVPPIPISKEHLDALPLVAC